MIRLVVAAVAWMMLSGVAAAGAANTAAAAAVAEGGMSSCGQQYNGKQLTDCVGDLIISFGSDLKCNNCLDSSLGGVVQSAGRQLKAATGKAQAQSVLNRARQIMEGLAAKSSGESRDMYNRVNRAYARALSVIGKSA